MTNFQAILISGTTAFCLAIFTSIANFTVTRYAPRIAELIERKMKHIVKKQENAK